MSKDRADQVAKEDSDEKKVVVPEQAADEAASAGPNAEQTDAVFEGIADDASNAAAQEPDLAVQLQAAEDRVLRYQAELENYRKRMQREMEQNRKYAAAAVIRDLLTIVDNLNLAIQAAGDSAESSGLIQGVTMVVEQFESVLKQHNCEPIKDLGEPFDPNVHEAMAQEPSEEYAEGTISRVTRTGYQLHDRVVRPSQVFVSTGPPQPPAVDEPASSNDNENSDSSE